MNLITDNQAGLPVNMQTCSGNTNDQASFKRLIKSHIKCLKDAQESRYLIADSSLYVAETLQELQEQNQYFITRVPQKIKEAKEIIENANTLEFEVIDDNYSGVWIQSEYADVKQKWLCIRSKPAFHRESKTLYRQISKEFENAIIIAN